MDYKDPAVCLPNTDRQQRSCVFQPSVNYLVTKVHSCNFSKIND